MTRKYEIKQPRKCRNCSKATDCEFMSLLNRKPFDVSGILLDCRAFYIVFCELEERSRVPFGDIEKMKIYHEELEFGRRPFLMPAMVTNGMLAVELSLKALTLRETGMFDCTHEIDKLFYALPDVHKDALNNVIKEKAHQSDDTLKANLKTISNFFVEWRYFFQYEAMGYSNFLLEFIHIVCDYTIEKIDKDDDRT